MHSLARPYRWEPAGGGNLSVTDRLPVAAEASDRVSSRDRTDRASLRSEFDRRSEGMEGPPWPGRRPAVEPAPERADRAVVEPGSAKPDSRAIVVAWLRAELGADVNPAVKYGSRWAMVIACVGAR